MAPAPKRAIYNDLEKVPDPLVAEIVGGYLYTSPRPALPHALAGSTIGQDLNPFARQAGGAGGPGGWWILNEPELHLGADVLVPDLAGWRRTRLPMVPNEAYLTLAPDWVCEVVSPSTGRLDRVRKMPVYASQGVEHAWLVEPLKRRLEVFHLEHGHWELDAAYVNGGSERIAPFTEIEIDIRRWWDG